MAISYVGFAATAGTGGVDMDPLADGDWIFVWTFYPFAMTWAFADPTPWTLMRRTTGNTGTVELWARQWHTGDPTTYALNRTGYNGTNPDRRDENVTVVFRGLVAPPTIMSVTHVTSSGPTAYADAISHPAIKGVDWQVAFFVTKGGHIQANTNPPATQRIGSIGGSAPGFPGPSIAIGWLEVGEPGPRGPLGDPGGTDGEAATITATVTTSPTNDTYGVQIILPATPVAGWGAGMVRMGPN